MQDPSHKLGKDWKTVQDRAITTAADSGGFKILVADSDNAYAWKTAATLAEPAMPADTWIGNACAMDQEHVAAVYAPRSFTNKPDLMEGGAFTAVIDLKSGRVTKLPFTASLAYFTPSCNPQTRTAAFTAFRDNNSRLVTVDTKGRTSNDTSISGQVTSSVPIEDGLVAARGRHLVHINQETKKIRALDSTHGVPFDIRPTRSGIAFLDRAGTTARALLWNGRSTSTVAAGKLGDLALEQGMKGRVFLTGITTDTHLAGSSVTRVKVSADTDLSSLGRLAVDPVLTPGVRAGLDHINNAGMGFTKTERSPQTSGSQDPTDVGPGPLTITSTATVTGQKISQTVEDASSGKGKESFSPALLTPRQSGLAAAADDDRAHNPVDTDRWCSVPRNDVKALALQPTPNQVEWAVNMAIRGELRAKWIKQGGWRNQAGLSTVDPQGLFPPPALKGGGRIPAQVLLGVLAQESNLWQAEPGAVPGQMGNPLAAVAGFYGHKGETSEEYWKIRWHESDCGYGVGQVTDGMRLAGHAKPDETLLPPAQQKAVALDYAVNIAASMYILADKWNQVHTAGQTITVNNDDPSKPENWFAALWNYNLGFNENKGDGKPWGLGWYNNPANPFYPPSRHPFMADPRDAAKPQQWPYQEKVMGWAAWSIDTGYSYSTDGRQDWPGESVYSTAGFRPAWWVSPAQRDLVKPPLDAFCNATDHCNAASPPNCPDAECYQQYWWCGANVTWKANCATDCGNENIKYVTLREEPGRGYRLQYGSPKCPNDRDGLPSGALIVESVPDTTDTYGGCAPGTDAGHFKFTFYRNPESTGPGLGPYEAKGDLHQIGGGYGGHFWYTHTRDSAHLGGDGGRMTIDGTWTLDRSVSWARVLVHLPDTGAHTRQAKYVIGGADTTSKERHVPQRANRWVSLGVFRFTGAPQVTLTNTTADGTADEDVAWDSVAFQPLPGKPNHTVVAMGDSFTSGEGASDPGGDDYYSETDYYNEVAGDKTKNSCHRSKHAWSRRAVLPGEQLTVGELADVWSARMDFHFIACSGARHYNILNRPQNGELPQIGQGYLDQNTTLVTMSVGGNDARFGDIVKDCVLSATVCKSHAIENRSPDTGERIDGDTGPLDQWLPSWLHDTVRPRLVTTLNEIHNRAPDAKIVLMGYPRLIENTACAGATGVGTEEAPWLNDMANLLAWEMQGAVNDANELHRANAIFADPRDEFADKAVCGDPETVHGIVLSGHSRADDAPSSMKSFHPKVSGTALYADALENTLAGN
ncbi:SGNH/GDSL hydrolase family protein [Streptomyces sp. NPDC096205]|uniref:SGNH/GDSL hydrolase family protein n=1 Tax=Streptomyces sp. NPDC096205 TaxID=3366081 RepID=UPI00382AF140